MADDSALTDAMFLVDAAGHPDGRSHKTLSFSRTPTVLLTFAANRFTRDTARTYLKEFGLGAMDWRMLVMLTREPGCSAARASAAIGIDKGAISRSLARLEKSGLAGFEAVEEDGRVKRWFLSSRGIELHDRMLERAMSRLKTILQGFSKSDVQELNRLLGKLLSNMED